MSVNIVEEMQLVVDKTATKLNRTIYYMFGHPNEIVARLQELTNSPKSKDKKFPLVVLFTDIQVYRNDPLGFYGNARLNMIVANSTQQNYTAAQRLANNFKPILQPIKDELIIQIGRHRQFAFPDLVEYTEIERYFWGRDGLYGNDGNILNDYIDCIEIQNLKVNINNKNCSPSNNL